MTSRMRMLMTAIVGALALSACQFTGLNSQPVPFSKGGGKDDLRVTVVMENAVNLVPNSEVKVKEVTVGTVRRIDFDDWQAKITIGIEEDVELPANAVARIGQKSLLGAEYLELAPPVDEPPSQTLLASGDVIGLDHTGRYPETEEVLASVSLLLNGGGLGHIQTITRELNEALGGNEAEVQAFISELGDFMGTLDGQKADIIEAIAAVDALAAGYASDTATIDHALATLPDGVDALAAERAELTQALQAVGDFGDVVNEVVADTQDDLIANLDNLALTVGGIAAADDVLVNALNSIPWPFTVDAVERGFAGDYINLFMTLDVSIGALERDWLAGTPLEGIYSGLLGLVPIDDVTGALDPLLNPITGLVDGSEGTQINPLPVPVCWLDDLLGDVGGLCQFEPNTDTVPGNTSGEPVGPQAPGPKSEGLLDGLLRSLMGGG